MTVDKRELYLHVEAETWAETVELHPEKGKQPRGLAQAINVAARVIRFGRCSCGARAVALSP